MGEVEVHALRGVDLQLFGGEFTVLLGPSGSGKSTLLNILGGLDVPTTGEVIYRGMDLTRASQRQLTYFRRERVGFVFQFYNLIPSLTALENVSLVTDVAVDPMSPIERLTSSIWRIGRITSLLSCRGANSNGLQLRGQSRNVLMCSFVTSPLGRSMLLRASPCWMRSAGSIANSVPRRL